MRRGVTTWLTIVLVLALVGAIEAATSTVVLAIDGMTWGTWPLVVKRALEGLKGVTRADVSFRAKEARVVFDPTQVSVGEMVDAVKRVGFDASVKREASVESLPAAKEPAR